MQPQNRTETPLYMRRRLSPPWTDLRVDIFALVSRLYVLCVFQHPWISASADVRRRTPT